MRHVTLRLALLMAFLISSTMANAEDYGQYPAPDFTTRFPRSVPTGEFVVVPPYGLLPLRLYDTPPLGPFYNVPPYRVIAPY